MHPDELDDQWIRQAACVDDAAVERVARAALASKGRRRRRLGRSAWPLLVTMAAIVMAVLMLMFVPRRDRRSAVVFSMGVDESTVAIQTSDGTLLILTPASVKSSPVGTCIVIAAGGTQ